MKSLLSKLCLIGLVLTTTGCASLGMKLKSLMNGGADPLQNQEGEPTKFSDQNNVNQGADRDYNRMTKSRMMRESELGERAGSLWAMEGQSAYLFSQNNSRLIGDILTVNLDGQPRKQLVSKVKVIKDLVDQYEKQAAADAAASTANETENADGQTPPVAGAPQAAAGQAPAQQAAQSDPAKDAAGAGGDSESDKIFDVQAVSTQVTEKTKDGSYRVQGEQTFMIGSREYKVSVKGIVKPEDFNESGVSADRLLDPKFDIISSKSTEGPKGMSL